MFFRLIRRVWSDEKGEGLVEYGLIIAVIAILIIGFLVAVNSGGGSSIFGNINGVN